MATSGNAPADIYPVLYEDMEELIDFFQIAHHRQEILHAILNQNALDFNMDAKEQIEFRNSLQQLAIQIEWCYDHQYNYGKVLRRIPLKLYTALHHRNGALQITALATSLEAAYQNESLMIDVMR